MSELEEKNQREYSESIKKLYKVLIARVDALSVFIDSDEDYGGPINNYSIARYQYNLQQKVDQLETDVNSFIKNYQSQFFRELDNSDPDELKRIERKLLNTLSAIDVDISNMSFTTEKKDKDASTESQDMESQNTLSENMEWGYYKGYSSLCHADSLCLAHDLNVGNDIDYMKKEKFLNYAKSKKWIFENGWVDIDSLKFTQEYAKATNTKPPISKTRLDDKSAARYGQAISWIPDEKDKNNMWHKVHKVVWDFYKNNVYFNPWTRDKWSHNLPYKPRLRFKYYKY